MASQRQKRDPITEMLAPILALEQVGQNDLRTVSELDSLSRQQQLFPFQLQEAEQGVQLLNTRNRLAERELQQPPDQARLNQLVQAASSLLSYGDDVGRATGQQIMEYIAQRFGFTPRQNTEQQAMREALMAKLQPQ